MITDGYVLHDRSTRRAVERLIDVRVPTSPLLARLTYGVDFVRELLTQIAHLGA